MSNITLQFGQCGNQIGQALYNCIHEDIHMKSECNRNMNNEYVCESTNLWFDKKRDGLEARSLLIDTEEKVTHLAAYKKPYKFKNIISGSYGGSGNNWAFGYASRSLLVAKEVMEKLRLEMEKCDFITTILNILSSSGGTGSGVGTKIIELIRDEYPSKFITNIIVLPFEKGDVITQNYNAILTLAKLYDIADNTIMLQNDKILEISRKVLPKKEIQLADMNQIIAQQLTSVLQPINSNSFSQMISYLSCHPSYRFMQLKTAPHTNKDHLSYEAVPNWSTLTKQVFSSSKQDLLLNHKSCKTVRYIGNLVMARGDGKDVQNIDTKIFQEPSSMYVSWVPKSERLIHGIQSRQLLNYQRFISLITNNSNICNNLDHLIGDAWNLFTHGAYVHHYKKYGVDDEYFLSAFQKMENILNDYKNL